jgi:hypothetical protein
MSEQDKKRIDNQYKVARKAWADRKKMVLPIN